MLFSQQTGCALHDVLPVPIMGISERVTPLQETKSVNTIHARVYARDKYKNINLHRNVGIRDHDAEYAQEM